MGQRLGLETLAPSRYQPSSHKGPWAPPRGAPPPEAPGCLLRVEGRVRCVGPTGPTSIRVRRVLR